MSMQVTVLPGHNVMWTTPSANNNLPLIYTGGETLTVDNITGASWISAGLVSEYIPYTNLRVNSVTDSTGLILQGFIDPAGNFYPIGGGTVPVTVIAASGASQALAFPSSGNICYDITLAANTAFTILGGTAGQLQTMTIILKQSGIGGFTPSFTNTIKVNGGVLPTFNTVAGKIDKFTLSTDDASTTFLMGA